MVVFCLHYLGGSAREWSHLAESLEAEHRIVPIDLPGFGDAAQTQGYSVDDMAHSVSETIRTIAPERWMLAGHSMGAKVALAIARASEDGAEGLGGLAGLVLLAGSPPSPEPMEESQRKKMLGWFLGDADASRAQAREFVATNSEAGLSAGDARMAEDDVLRMNRAAWVAWLESGSREDRSQRTGVLRTRALVIAGADDPALGPDAQRRLMLPHFAHASLVSLPHAKHLLPMECARDVARLIHENAREAAYRALLASTRVSRGTRAALESRDRADDPSYVSVVLEASSLHTLRAIVDRVIPQRGATHVDLAARIDAELAAGEGDGWRFARLPADADAYRAGLATIERFSQRRYGASFTTLDAPRADALLHDVAAGSTQHDKAESAPLPLSDAQLKLWFEDLRADAVRAFLGHPSSLARIGYSGVANGGDGSPKSGFARANEREAWEPVANADGLP